MNRRGFLALTGMAALSTAVVPPTLALAEPVLWRFYESSSSFIAIPRYRYLNITYAHVQEPDTFLISHFNERPPEGNEPATAPWLRHRIVTHRRLNPVDTSWTSRYEVTLLSERECTMVKSLRYNLILKSIAKYEQVYGLPQGDLLTRFNKWADA